MTQSWSDEAVTDALPVAELSGYEDQPTFYPSLRLVKFLFGLVAIAAVVASVAVARHMVDRPTGATPTVDAHEGECLTWPSGAPERAMQIDCRDEHLFEVADSVAVEGNSAAYGQICAQAVSRYLGPRYDPGGRFVVGMVLTSSVHNGRLLCGLQLPSDGVASVGFQGHVADQDQSRVWPAGTCLGIRDGGSTEIPVSCALPHAVEISGAADLSTVFGKAAPSTSAQDAVVRDACGAATSAYLPDTALDATGLTLRYQPIDAAGWDAGSRRIACRLGAPGPDGGWATLVGAAKTGVVINGQAAAAPPGPPAPPPAETPVPGVESEQPSELPERAIPHADVSTAVLDEAPDLVDSQAPPAAPPPEPEPPAPDAAG